MRRIDTGEVAKILRLSLPYVMFGLYATKFGLAWRLAPGADAAQKFLSFTDSLSAALQTPFPSFHPVDLTVGLLCGLGLRLAVCVQSMKAKKYRHGMEYGAARWGTAKDIRPYADPVFENT